METVKLNEDVGKWIENGLLIGGFIPVIGEVADLILISKFFYEKRWIEAGLTIFALLPTVGDTIVKPILFLGKGVLKTPGSFLKLLNTNSKAKGLFLNLRKYINHPKLNSLIAQITKKNKNLGMGFQKAKDTIVGLINKLSGGAKNGRLNSVISPGKLLKRSYQAAAIKRFRKRFGNTPPKNALMKWYQFNYKAGLQRRRDLSRLLLANNFFTSLGIRNFLDLETYFKDENKANQLANTEEMNDFLDKAEGNTTNTEETPETNNGEGIGSDIGYSMLIPMLKKMAMKMA